jgi:hypothetical protein
VERQLAAARVLGGGGEGSRSSPGSEDGGVGFPGRFPRPEVDVGLGAFEVKNSSGVQHARPARCQAEYDAAGRYLARPWVLQLRSGGVAVARVRGLASDPERRSDLTPRGGLAGPGHQGDAQRLHLVLNDAQTRKRLQRVKRMQRDEQIRLNRRDGAGDLSAELDQSGLLGTVHGRECTSRQLDK